MLRVFRNKEARPAGSLGLVMVAGLLLFSATENMISYSWVLVPLGIAAGLVLRHHSPVEAVGQLGLESPHDRSLQVQSPLKSKK